MTGTTSNGSAQKGPLHAGVTGLLAAIRTEEWVFARSLCPSQLEEAGTPAAPSIKELVARASAARRTATKLLRTVGHGGEADGCEEPGEPRLGTWVEVHRDAHAAMSDLWAAVEQVSEDQLTADAGPPRSHPQYLWRDVINLAVRGPFHSYADWHLRAGRVLGSLAVLSRWYEAVRGPDLPTKVRSDASYDLACGLARVGRLDAAMEYLPDAFT
ncbi:MAG: hypothetical protein ACM30G_19650, partial [Micromonosporaceae bacterium]